LESDDEIPASKEYKAAQAPVASSSKVLATPVARKMAKDLGVDLVTLKGSGPNGRVMKADIQNASGSAPQSVAAPQVQASMPAFKGERVHREKITSLRKAIVKAMNVSNQVIPATTLIDTFEVDELVKLRATLKPKSDPQTGRG